MTGYAPLRDPGIVGREQEQQRLRALLDPIAAGRGMLALISGEAGIGKTTLVRDLTEQPAARGWLVLHGGCYDLTSTPPYGPWIELLGSTSPREGTANLLDRVQESGNLRAGELQQRLFDGIVEVLQETAAHQPVVAVLEDLHWSDPDSLDLLRYVGRRITRLPLLVIGTYRDDELTRHDPLYRVLPALVREAQTERVRLGQLSTSALRELVDARYGLEADAAERLVTYLHQTADGNPLFTRELLRTLEERGTLVVDNGSVRLAALDDVPVPELVQQLVDLRVEGFDQDVQSQLELAAVIGQTVQVDLWARVGELEARDLFEAMERGTAAGLLGVEEDGTAIRFTHALVREALYNRIFPPRRRDWHRTIGDILAAGPDPHPGAVANHFERSGDQRAVDWMIRAGDHAMRFAGMQTGFKSYQRALARLEEGDVDDLALQGWLLARLGLLMIGSQLSIDAAGQYATRATQIADRLDSAALGAFARGLLIMVQLLQGEEIVGASSVAAEWEALSDDDRAELNSQLAPIGFSELAGWAFLAWTLARSGRYAQSRAIIDGVLESWDPDAAGAVVNDWLHIAMAFSSAALGDPASARQAFSRASELSVGWMPNYSSGQDFTQVHLIYYADDLEERSDLRRQFAEARRIFQERGFQLPDLAPPQAWAAWIEGNWDWLRESRGDDHKYTIYPMTSVFALLARAEGDRERAWGYVNALLPKGPAAGRDDIWFDSLLPLQRLAGELALDEGNLELAREWIDANQRWLDETGRLQGRAEFNLLRARYHELAGDQAAARAHAERALGHATDPRQPLALLAAHRFLGRLDVRNGEMERAESQLNRALTLADACAAPLERALALLEVARLRIASMDGEGASRALDEAREICERLRAQPALDMLAELRASIQDEGANEASPYGLSPREREVLQLLVDGKSDREIAAALYISPRTAMSHVANIRNKLGVESRTAAASIAIREGLV